MSFKSDMNDDLQSVFFNIEEFGEQVTLTRSGTQYSMRGMFDVQCLDGETLGNDVSAISHRPRLFVRSVDLPECKARKNDLWDVAATPQHPAYALRAVDFAFEADGVVVYQLEFRRRD